MSLTTPVEAQGGQGTAAAQSAAPAKVTVDTLRERKRTHTPITALTAYDYPTARLLDAAGIDLVLVGDSLAMAVLGHPDTLSVTVDEMLHHTRAVRRGLSRAFLVADMPFGSYHTSEDQAVLNAIRFVKEAGAQAVKLEGGTSRASVVARITAAEIPVVGHLGLTPQSVNIMGGYRVQGRTSAAIDQLLADAHAIERAGAIALVLEGIPREVAASISRALAIPVIGIGAGPDCDGQILVLHDLAGLTFTPASPGLPLEPAKPAKFARRFTDAGAQLQLAAEHFRDEVLARTFPADAESYHLPAGVQTAETAASPHPASATGHPAEVEAEALATTLVEG